MIITGYFDLIYNMFLCLVSIHQSKLLIIEILNCFNKYQKLKVYIVSTLFKCPGNIKHLKHTIYVEFDNV